MKQRLEGIDHLRAVMSLFVVAWHMQGAGRSSIFSKEAFSRHSFTLSDFVNFHLLLLAVPMFVFVSVYLYARNPVTTVGLGHRLGRLAILGTFWPVTLIIYYARYSGLRQALPGSLAEGVRFVLRAGNSQYYFFPSLMLCLIAAHLFLMLGRRTQIGVFVLSCGLLAALAPLTMLTQFPAISAYWNPSSFFPVAFAAVLIARHEGFFERYRTPVVMISIAMAAVLAVLEWRFFVGEVFFGGQSCALPCYARPSLLFSVVALALLALHPSITSGPFVRFLAANSLTLFCLHPFFMPLVRKSRWTGEQAVGVDRLAEMLAVILLSYGAGMVLRRWYLKRDLLT
jgi:peptidoglycan/LPS O-acetylase OafA/YrhL